MARDASSPATPSVSELNACVSTATGHHHHHHRPATKETTFREWMVANQIGISLTILSMLLAVHHLYPSLNPYTAPFFQLSYYQPASGDYVQGWDDVFFVASSAVAFMAIRAMIMDWILQPLAQSYGLKKKASVRLAEQGWLAVYYGFFCSLGMYLWSNSYYWREYSAIWDQWPTRNVSGLLKWYLLVQLAFWVQQLLVINIEERRKDHYQMLTHHVITIGLFGSAYVYGFYNVSNVVLALMDVVDLLLPTAKILKYLKFETSCNIAFVVFMVTWLVTRHIYYPQLCWSIYKDVPAKMAYGCYSGTTAEMTSTNGYPDQWRYLLSPFKNIDGPICMNRTVKWIFLSSLLALQLLSLIWFTMVIRVAVGVIRTGNAEEPRSDDEDEVEENSTDKDGPSGTASVADGSSTEWRRANASNVRPRGRGRVRLGDQSDHKALLGRIGCDKPT
ncbi:longevity-assurance protein [Aspergillus ellipticus CBS 707.79]|uniref:Longevity-assurance protein n=1 Tax=Aspergillus ellipticus CBS 707.79 TaxID=1448320 RepID=A0A319DJ41_9EURO|nr:longevity-assurance protein [Aspergillus ellipticus CBS 707.79]